MKTALILAMLAALVACTQSGGDDSSTTPAPVLDKFNFDADGMRDCTGYEVYYNHYGSVTAIRCPNSTVTTTYRQGKSSRTVVVIDGVTYAPVAASEPQQ
jgi:hypothetical protein